MPPRPSGVSWPPDLEVALVQLPIGMERAVMDNVAVYVEQAGAAIALPDNLALPDLVEHGSRLGLCFRLPCALLKGDRQR